MKEDQIEKRIRELEELINKANVEYYLDDAPTISDADYDSLFRELENLENQHPRYASKDSPTKRVGVNLDGAKQSSFSKHTHLEPMLSLANAMDEDEFRSFDERIRKSELETSEGIEYCAEFKLDGLAISLSYQNGKLVRGVTRGDGFTGEDITENIKSIKSIPHFLTGPTVPDREIEIRGEIVLPIVDFIALNQTRLENNESVFANPRNAAAGSVRTLDPGITASRPLKFFAYSLAPIDRIDVPTQSELYSTFSSWGLPVFPNFKVSRSVEEVLLYFREIEQGRDSLDVEVDGVVVKVNRISYHEVLGTRARSPRWAIALKFKPREAQTRIEDISVQVGRTGTLTPVAELTPVTVGGVVVSRATLHNQDEIDRKDVRIGDSVIVRRQGDVIPAVVEVITAERTGSEKVFKLPDICPVCGSKAGRESDSDAAIRCFNHSCPAKLVQRIRHFVSRLAFNVDGFGERLVEALVEAELLKTPADIFKLAKEQISNLDRMGEKSAQNILDALKSSKEITFSRFIYALGIRHVGEQTAQVLAQTFTRFEKLTEASVEKLQEIEDVGPRVASAVFDFFNDESEMAWVNMLFECGVKIKEEDSIGISKKLDGETIVVTGTLANFTRSGIKKLIEQHGGKVTSSVGKATTLLVVGANPGSKLAKAEKLGIPVLGEQALIERLDLHS